MRTWFGSILLVVVGAFAVASGCGTTEAPPGSRLDTDSPDASVGGATGSSGTGNSIAGGLVIGNSGTGNSDGCPSTCAQLNANCGFVTDTRCGNVIECGTCKDGEFCGGDGESRCGAGTGEGGACSGPNCMSCVPKTCAEQGFTCGPAGDTCGNQLDCGTTSCGTPGWTCGGGGKVGACGCTGVCSQIPNCSASALKTTSISGVVFDPAGVNPLYNVFVYVANDPTDPDLLSFKPGVTCDVCGATAAGSPLLSDSNGTFGTFTDTAGHFKLNNVPAGKGITLVIQLGRWRRIFKVDVDKPCDDNLATGLLMPSKKSQGDIPLIAMVTGGSDSIECTLRKMGIDATEFTNPAGGGRVQFYLGSNQNGATDRYGQKIDANTPMQAALFANDAGGKPVINGYDMTMLACQGAAPQQSPTDQATLRNYAASGGRVFTTHYAFSWLNQNNANAGQVNLADNWGETAKWHVDEGDRINPVDGHVDLVSNPKGDAFQHWLLNVNASPSGLGTTSVTFAMHDTDSISSVPGQVQQWLYRDGTNKKKCKAGGQTCSNDATCGGTDTCVGTDYTGTKLPLHFTFNTPVNLVQDLTKNPPSVQCGRVLYSDFHVQDVHEHDKVFPAQCDTAPMSPQEKLLEYMIFDLGSCVPPGKACVPATQCPAGENCGYAPDGCGGLISCGVCPTGQSCGVGMPPVPNKCGKGTQTCTPKTCAAQGLECGPAADGCGEKIDSCGQCAAGELCVTGKCAHVN